MSSTSVALVSAGCIFAGALLGLALQPLLPGHHLSKETQDVVKIGAGTIAILTGIVQGSAKIILLDTDLAHYGIEAKENRDLLRNTIGCQ